MQLNNIESEHAQGLQALRSHTRRHNALQKPLLLHEWVGVMSCTSLRAYPDSGSAPPGAVPPLPIAVATGGGAGAVCRSGAPPPTLRTTTRGAASPLGARVSCSGVPAPHLSFLICPAHPRCDYLITSS